MHSLITFSGFTCALAGLAVANANVDTSMPDMTVNAIFAIDAVKNTDPSFISFGLIDESSSPDAFLTSCSHSWPSQGGFPTDYIECDNPRYRFKFPTGGFVTSNDFTLDIECSSTVTAASKRVSLRYAPKDFNCDSVLSALGETHSVECQLKERQTEYRHMDFMGQKKLELKR